MLISRDIVGKTVRLVHSNQQDEDAEESIWLSIHRETGKVLLSGQEMSLETEEAEVRSDVALMVKYFENYRNGFLGDVKQHQRDYFMFMCWFYAAPFVCDLRNHAAVEDGYVFDFPMFAILYGKSNCGKTRLIETIMKSMFGYWRFIEKSYFTRSNLRGLLNARRRFPVVYDDVERKRFTDHATDIIKDEMVMQEEYPAFVLSMNAEDHTFATEIRKRCFILYTRASLPDNSEDAKRLHTSVKKIQSNLSTALYREYLRRMLDRFRDDPYPTDLLRFSSEILMRIFTKFSDASLPEWCATSTMQSYQERKYDKIQQELRKLYDTNPDVWEVRPQEIILEVERNEMFLMRREIPDWILKEGSRAGKLVMDRKQLEEFLNTSFSRSWWRKGRR